MSFFNIVAATNEDTVVAAYEPSKVRSDSYQSEAELEKEFIRLLCEQGYTYLPLHTEDELIANLRSQLEELNHYQFSDTEWQQFFSDVIANPNEHIPEKTRKIQEDNVQVLHRTWRQSPRSPKSSARPSAGSVPSSRASRCISMWPSSSACSAWWRRLTASTRCSLHHALLTLFRQVPLSR